jgi:hypothetical protein
MAEERLRAIEVVSQEPFQTALAAMGMPPEEATAWTVVTDPAELAGDAYAKKIFVNPSLVHIEMDRAAREIGRSYGFHYPHMFDAVAPKVALAMMAYETSNAYPAPKQQRVMDLLARHGGLVGLGTTAAIAGAEYGGFGIRFIPLEIVTGWLGSIPVRHHLLMHKLHASDTPERDAMARVHSQNPNVLDDLRQAMRARYSE